MREFIRKFVKDESGPTAIEYGLLVGLISVLIIAGAALAGAGLNNTFSKIAVCITTPSGTCWTG